MPARRARVTHAASTSVAVLEASRRDDPEGPDTVPLSSPAAAWSAPAGRQTPVWPHTALRSAARGLMMTPWFAAASGFVIAASLWIYSPHAHLQFNNPSNGIIRTQLCHDRCAQGGRHQGTGSLASSAKNRLPDRRVSRAVSGLTFSYYMPRRPGDGFTIWISVTGNRAIKDWTLAFVLPGDRIRWVEGASWHRRGPDRGTASGAADQAGNWRSDWQDGHGQFSGSHQQYVVTFVVSGAGRQVAPTSCQYDGQACTFRQGWEGHPGTG